MFHRLRRPLYVLLVSAFALLAVAVLWLGFHTQVNFTVQQVENMITAELPRNPTQAAVEGWFDKHGIEHDTFSGIVTDHINGEPVWQTAKLKQDDFRSWTRGTIPEAERSFLLVKTINVYFFFDQDGKPLTHLVLSHTIGL